jgi:hypothetical protein
MSVEKVGRFAFGNRSGGPSDLSPASGSQPSGRSSAIAGALADLRGLAIGMAAAFAVLGLMRVTL